MAGSSPATPIFTRTQLTRLLAANGIPTLTLEEAVQLGLLGGGLHTPPEYASVARVFGRGANAQSLRTGFAGSMSEYMYGARAGGPGVVDLNSAPWQRGPGGSPQVGSHPTWDFELPSERISIKSPLGDRAARFAYCDDGLRGMRRGASFDLAVWNRNPGLGWPPPAGSSTPQSPAEVAWAEARGPRDGAGTARRQRR